MNDQELKEAFASIQKHFGQKWNCLPRVVCISLMYTPKEVPAIDSKSESVEWGYVLIIEELGRMDKRTEVYQDCAIIWQPTLSGAVQSALREEIQCSWHWEEAVKKMKEFSADRKNIWKTARGQAGLPR